MKVYTSPVDGDLLSIGAESVETAQAAGVGGSVTTIGSAGVWAGGLAIDQLRVSDGMLIEP